MRWQAVFLDRDGTINVKAPEGAYVNRPEDVELLPGAAAAIARLNRAAVPVVLVTNQRWMSRPGERVEERYAATHARLVELLAREDATLDRAYHCPHAADSCACRKPGAGMLLDAARDMGLDLRSTAIVGDAATDVLAGRVVGATTVLLDRNGRTHPAADTIAPDIAAAVEMLLAQEGAESLRP